MRIWAIFKKELRLYFTSPVAYVVGTMFLLIAGVFFYLSFGTFSIYSMQAAMNPQFARDLNVTEAVFRPLLSNTFSVVLLLLMPILTMRLFAEEKKTGTVELLLTYPIKDGEVLIGKFLSALVLYIVILACTALYPALAAYLTTVEMAPLLTGYLGLLLMGAAFIAVGLLASSLTENQIVAAVATFGILLILWVLGWSAEIVGPTWGKVMTHLSILEHQESFGKGVIETKDVTYYVNLTIFCLFLTLRSLESKRWRG